MHVPPILAFWCIVLYSVSFIGSYRNHVGQSSSKLPPKKLIATRLAKPVDRVFIKYLKQEMLANLTTDVAPMIGLVHLQPEVESEL